MGEEKDTGPATQASWGPGRVPRLQLSSHQNSPVLCNCGRIEAPSLPLPPSTHSSSDIRVKVQGSGTPWAQKRGGGFRKDWTCAQW